MAARTFCGLLKSNERLGRCTYVGMAMNEKKVAAAVRNQSRVCAEAHTSPASFWTAVAALRRMPLQVRACSGIKVVLRVREPFAWYVSWYLWPTAFNGRVRLNSTTVPANQQAPSTAVLAASLLCTCMCVVCVLCLPGRMCGVACIH